MSSWVAWARSRRRRDPSSIDPAGDGELPLPWEKPHSSPARGPTLGSAPTAHPRAPGTRDVLGSSSACRSAARPSLGVGSFAPDRRAHFRLHALPRTDDGPGCARAVSGMRRRVVIRARSGFTPPHDVPLRSLWSPHRARGHAARRLSPTWSRGVCGPLPLVIRNHREPMGRFVRAPGRPAGRSGTRIRREFC